MLSSWMVVDQCCLLTGNASMKKNERNVLYENVWKRQFLLHELLPSFLKPWPEGPVAMGIYALQV